MTRLRTRLVSALFAACLVAGCTGGETDPDCTGEKCDEPGQRTETLCAGVRGNGQLISAHFASLSRIVEHYGLLDGASGGSSGSISLFITESVQMNPAIYSCGDAECSTAETNARAGLLLKSFQGYLQALSTTDEATAFLTLAPLAQRVQTSGVEALLQSDVPAATAALIDILESEDIRDLINPELVTMLRNSPNPAFHVQDIVDGIQGFGDFAADNDRILIRPGLLDFEALADKLGRAGSFYAGYGPADESGTEAFMSACATPGRGKVWKDVSALAAGDSTCGELFGKLVIDYRTDFINGNVQSRADDKVGAYMPALISTSVMTGDAAEQWRAARADYNNASEYTFSTKFEDIRFGYWGQSSDLARVESNPLGFDDAKTAKFLSLGEATWREVLGYSPAEPGLARGLELPGDYVSAGGWSDLHPVLALKNMGCDKVVYVTRTGNESGFAQGVATVFGMTEADKDALYNLDNPDSAYSQSVAQADGVWCTNWNDFAGTQVDTIYEDAFNAQLETSDDFFTRGSNAYHGATSGIDKRGCTPGAK